MKTKSRYAQQDMDKAGETAKSLLKDAISAITSAGKSSNTVEPVRLFFPNGINYFNVTVKAPGGIEVGLTVSDDSKKPSQQVSVLRLMGDAQGVIDSCEKQWDQFKSDCSGFVKAVATDFGIVLMGQADDIVDQIDSNGWEKAADGSEAARKAEAGCFVLAGLKGADHNPPRKNGHVVVVVKGSLASGKYPTAYWGSLGGVGKKNTTLNYAWTAKDRDNVTYRFKKIT